jgi:hypothetical protein
MALFDHTPSVILYQIYAEKLTNESRWLAGLDEVYQKSQWDVAFQALTGDAGLVDRLAASAGLRETVR